jgi:hypothetical protein
MVDCSHHGRRLRGRPARTALTLVLIGTLLGPPAGCSFLFVQAPSPESHRGVRACTSSNAAPVIDLLIGGFQLVRTLSALGATDAQYANAPISRDADITFGIGLLTLFTGSAIAGFNWTSQCREGGEDSTPASRPGPRVSRQQPGWKLGPPPAAQRKVEEQEEEAAVQARTAARARAAREAAQAPSAPDAGSPAD